MIVRKLRLQRGWTQEQLAELAGLSVRSIQRIERGQAASLETLKSLAAVFEVYLAILQPGEAEMNERISVSEEEKAAMEYVKGIKEFWSHFIMYAVFIVAFMIGFGPAHPAVYWTAFGWGLGILAHGLVAYEYLGFFGPGWERRMIEKRLGRKL